MIIAFRSNGEDKPTLEVNNNKLDQVVIRFISRDEHITIHLQEDGILRRTHYYPKKQSSVWDDERINIARELKNPTPERHGSYVINTPLVNISNLTGYHLVGRLINLSEINPKKQYFKNISKTFNVSRDKFMLTLYLSTRENPGDPELERVTTSLGELCFAISE